MYWFGLAVIPIQLYALWIARRVVRGTSLTVAWWWAVMAVTVWSITALLAGESSGLLDHVAYSGVICWLTPAIAILGARRPGIGAWSGFVVLPMVVVLHWPAVSQLMGGSIDDAFELPVPMVIGVCLVIVMGLGNFFGTRFTLPAMLLAAGMGLILRTLSQPDTIRSPDVHRVVPIASILLTFAALLFIRRARQLLVVDGSDEDVRVRLNVMWADFQELFGIVWAKRAMDRINQFGQREAWPVRLELTGFEAKEPNCTISAEAVARIRWVLRRFVDPCWLDARLRPGADVTKISELKGSENHQTDAV
ncbi:MAG: hypothetical protein AB8G99_11570 [Planctomycetaceae bacterium]